MATWRKVIVSGSDAELNTLDIGGGSGGSGTTLSTAGAITADAAVTAGTSFIIGSADINETDLEKLDGITNGTATANKALVVDGNKDIGTLRNLTIDGTFSDGNYTFDTSGNVSGLGTVGCGAITTSGNLAVTGTITGDTSLTLDSTTLTTAELGVLDSVTAGTAAASKALVLDASKDIATIRNLTIDGTFSDGNYTFDTSGNVSGLGTVGCGAITAGGTSTFATAIEPDADDGATIGSADKNWSDLYIADAGVVNLGDDQDVTLTHVVDTGILLNSTRQLQFNDSTQYIAASSGADLDIAATTDVNIEATTLDVNAILDVSGTATFGSTITAGSLGTDTDNTVVVVNGSGLLKTDEIDSKVWDGNLVDTDGSGTNNELVTWSDSDSIIGESNLTFDGSTLAVTGNQTISGDLTVNGTTTTLATTNLAVQDAFLFAATGSASSNVDAGLIVQSGSAVDSGSAIYNDISSQRWAVAKGVGSISAAVTPLQMVVTTAVSASSPHSSYGEYGVGEMWIETDTQDIWIRTA